MSLFTSVEKTTNLTDLTSIKDDSPPHKTKSTCSNMCSLPYLNEFRTIFLPQAKREEVI